MPIVDGTLQETSEANFVGGSQVGLAHNPMWLGQLIFREKGGGGYTLPIINGTDVRKLQGHVDEYPDCPATVFLRNIATGAEKPILTMAISTSVGAVEYSDHEGHWRTVPIPPKAQSVLKGFL